MTRNIHNEGQRHTINNKKRVKNTVTPEPTNEKEKSNFSILAKRGNAFPLFYNKMYVIFFSFFFLISATIEVFSETIQNEMRQLSLVVGVQCTV